MRKTETVTIDDAEIKLSTVTVDAIETIVLDGKQGRKFNIAFIAAAILSAGDVAHGTEKWVRSQAAFSADPTVQPDFNVLLDAANRVNGFKPTTVVMKSGEDEPAAPAAE